MCRRLYIAADVAVDVEITRSNHQFCDSLSVGDDDSSDSIITTLSVCV